MPRARLRDLGITTGTLPTGQWNAITDVPGVRVGYTTLIRDEPAVIRTGVTAIWPRGPELWTDAVFAGIHSFNGNGEMTGWAWIAEQGLLASPICITNTHCVGVVRDAICALAVRDKVPMPWLLAGRGGNPRRLAERCRDIPGHRRTCVRRAGRRRFRADRGGQCGRRHRHDLPRVQGRHRNRLAHGAQAAGNTYTVGALVQANYGARGLLRVDGVPVGREIGLDAVPSPRGAPTDAGSIIVILATDAPLLPIQCQRLARRATTGLAWVGGVGFNSSGDIFLAFATGNHVHHGEAIATVRMLSPDDDKSAVPGGGGGDRRGNP